MELDEIKVLVVDDQQNTRATARQMLSEIGISNVSEAADGKEAQELMESEEADFNMIISGWEMPGVSGLDLLKELRSKENSIPFIMVTARNDVDSVMEAKEAGVDGYISKPFSLKDLQSKVIKLKDNIQP